MSLVRYNLLLLAHLLIRFVKLSLDYDRGIV